MKGQANNLTLPPLEEILNFFRQEVNELLKNLLENLSLRKEAFILNSKKENTNGFLLEIYLQSMRESKV